jgi:hypothetical protein
MRGIINMADSQIQCPNCGSYDTAPYDSPFWLYLVPLTDDQVFYNFTNPRVSRKFMEGKIRAACRSCQLIFRIDTVVPNPINNNLKKINQSGNQKRSSEERLAELKRLLAQGIITGQEYKKKREDILHEL